MISDGYRCPLYDDDAAVTTTDLGSDQAQHQLDSAVPCPRYQRKRVRRASPLAVVMPLVNTDRLVSSRRYLMVQQRCRQARTTGCMFGFLKPSDRSSGLRSFGLSEAEHSGSLSGSRPMQQRLVCVEAGQTFSMQRMEVLTPQVSSIHCRLTRGRSLVRSQSGPQQKTQLRSSI
jgi:hypothetical protein